MVSQGVERMRRVSVREMRALLPELESTLAEEGELLLTRHGKPIARLTSLSGPRHRLSTAALRAQMKPLRVPSEVLIRQDRDER
jgi:antitoxin (DNA-binding transcriptional repressor) of toxin-antitoxin stability system